MTKLNLLQRIENHNHGRDPVRLRMKYEAMANDPFAFFRGSNRLFCEDWPARSSLNNTPLTWVCGDLHLENFGAYKGDNRLTYFDLNDFDESALAPCAWDLSRFLTSLLLATVEPRLDHSERRSLCQVFLQAYSSELACGKARWIERATATGMVRKLLKGLKKRSRSDYLEERTVELDGRLRLRVDNGKALPCTRAERQKVARIVGQFSRKRLGADCIEVLDVARRVAGLGALGLERYAVLVEREGEKAPYLLDIKHQPGSSLKPYLKTPQPNWKSEADRVVALQSRMQAISPAFLYAASYGDRSYVLRELLPQQQRLDLRKWNGKPGPLSKIVRTMGELVAWANLRSAGRQGSANADAWTAFGKRTGWHKPLLDYAGHYAEVTMDYWQTFRRDARDAGWLDP
jgi:uncharacterized protein (DUF2252 family)